MGKAIKKVTKAVSKPFKSMAHSVSRGVSSVFKLAGDAVGKVGEALGLKPEVPEIEAQEAAPPAPSPEQYAEEMSRPENISRRRRNHRNRLRVDLNTGGSPAGNGVNVPVG